MIKIINTFREMYIIFNNMLMKHFHKIFFFKKRIVLFGFISEVELGGSGVWGKPQLLSCVASSRPAWVTKTLSITRQTTNKYFQWQV